MSARPLAAIIAAGMGAVGVVLRCRLGLHSPVWEFVGSSWHPDLYIRVCSRCGVQVYDRTSQDSGDAS